MTPEEILATLYNWLGESAVLLPIPLGTKEPDWTGWQTTTFEQTQTPEYQARLMAALKRGGNIGVLLKDGLTSIDIDNDAGVDECLSLNPEFSETLQSRGWIEEALVAPHTNPRGHLLGCTLNIKKSDTVNLTISISSNAHRGAIPDLLNLTGSPHNVF